MKPVALSTIVAVAAHITLSMGYVATVYEGSSCNINNPQFQSLSIAGFNVSATRTGCIAPSVFLNAGSFSLTGCAVGGTVSTFSDVACTKLLKTVDAAGIACAQSLPVRSLIINKC